MVGRVIIVKEKPPFSCNIKPIKEIVTYRYLNKSILPQQYIPFE